MKEINGLHLLIDGYVQNTESLNPDHVCDLFDRLVDVLGMKYLQRPTAVRVPLDYNKLSGDDDEGGWSVICQITTSHIALHGWPLRKAFMLDIFSCCHFDDDTAYGLVVDFLGVTKSSKQLIKRIDPIIGG